MVAGCGISSSISLSNVTAEVKPNMPRNSSSESKSEASAISFINSVMLSRDADAVAVLIWAEVGGVLLDDRYDYTVCRRWKLMQLNYVDQWFLGVVGVVVLGP